MLAIERSLITKQRRIFTPEFKREAACLVLDQAYSPLKRLFCSLKTEWILTVS